MPAELDANAEVTIAADGLTKIFGDFAAIREVSFGVRRAQVTAFLGPNGAGKSTTLRILSGFLAPTAGRALLAGLDVGRDRRAVAARIGYLPENGPLYPEMTPLGLLRFFGRARGLGAGRLRERLDAVVAQCALGTVIEKPIRKLSKGYRQRIGLAQALLHDPEILILDEPTSGLDPNQIRDVRRLIRALAHEKTILLSTHILQEVEAVVEHVILINEGRIAFDGTLAGMRREGETLDQAFSRLTRDEARGEGARVFGSAEPEAATGEERSRTPEADRPGAEDRSHP
jgi:ABC-2 type transport system ATP-binding protein